MRHGWWLVVTLSTMCACSEPCQWNQYLGNPGRTAYVYGSGPDFPEIFWEITLEGEVDHPFIFEDRVIVSCDTYCVFPSPPETAPQQNIAVIDLLTGTLVQRIVPEEDFLNVYAVKETLILGETYDKLYEIDISSGKTTCVSDIPMKAFCDPRCYPIILSDTIVFPTTPVVCISISDYRLLWNLETSLGSLYPENGKILNIAASQDRIYIIIDEEKGRRIWAVDSTTGAFVWVSDPLTVSEIAADRFALFAGGDKVYALNAETGKMLWTFESTLNSNIMVGGGAVYFSDNERLYAVDRKTGELKWESQWNGIPLWITYIVGSGDMVICSNVFDLSSFSQENGTQLWNVHFRNSTDMGTITKPCPAVAQDILITRKDGKEEILALASNPELFVKQGDAFVSAGSKEKAGNSYRKAVNLYEKNGNIEKAEEIKKRISELGLPLETQSPTPSASPLSSVPPSSEPPPLTKKSTIFIASIAAIIVLIMVAIYYFIKRKKQ